MLNALWFGFFLISALMALYQWLVLGNGAIFTALVQSTYDNAALAVEVSLGLVGVLCFWLGLLKVAEEGGLVRALARGMTPLFRRLMPGVPEGHPALGSITLNMAANMLGLDNAATPAGLKAMEQLQEVNPDKTTASDAQILFLVINASSVTLLPVTIFMYRAQAGAADPTAVFIPILLATSASTLTGLFAVAWMQKLPLFNRTVLAYLGGLLAVVAGLVLYTQAAPPEARAAASSLLGNLVLFAVMFGILAVGFVRRVPVYESFVEGAKEGFSVALRIIPFLVAMLVAVGMLRASGALEALLKGIAWVVEKLGGDPAFIPALPTALVKPFSGSGARAMMLDTMQTHGVDSFPALVSAIIQGSTETTFYVLAVYFGAVGITRARHAVGCALLADFAGVVAAVLVGYWFFG